MKNQCQDCTNFDNEKHKNSYQTRHAGICKKWVEITFLTDTCNQFFSKENPEELEPIKPKENEIFTPVQTALFFPL